MKKRFDAIIIGAGSGLTIASAAADAGKKVAVVDVGPFGGTCLNRGCIPSKMLIHTADVADVINTSETFGIHSKITKIDWKTLTSRVTKIVDSHARNIEQANRKNPRITVFRDQARFVGKHTLDVGKNTITAPHIFICAGLRPNIPPIPGLDSVPYITSSEALRLTQQPKKLIIIGGGYIGTELAHFFASLGTHVTIIDRNKILMKNEDADIAKRITRVYKKTCELVLNADVDSVSKQGRGISVVVNRGGKKQTITGDTLLVATGRRPNTDVLDVAAAGIKTWHHGFINVNRYMETNQQGIWAIGDIAGVYQFKHSANLEAQTVAQNVYGKGKKTPVNYKAMPHAAFTAPQIGSVGKTEEQLCEAGVDYVKATYDFIDTGYGMALDDRDGFVKLLASPDGRLLGCHIIGSEASILIHELVIAMRHNLTAQKLQDTIFVHPALSEVIQRALQALDL